MGSQSRHSLGTERQQRQSSGEVEKPALLHLDDEHLLLTPAYLVRIGRRPQEGHNMQLLKGICRGSTHQKSIRAHTRLKWGHLLNDLVEEIEEDVYLVNLRKRNQKTFKHTGKNKNKRLLPPQREHIFNVKNIPFRGPHAIGKLHKFDRNGRCSVLEVQEEGVMVLINPPAPEKLQSILAWLSSWCLHDSQGFISAEKVPKRSHLSDSLGRNLLS